MKKKPILELRSDNTHTAPALRNLLAKAELHQGAEQQVIAAIPVAIRSGVRFISSHDGDLTISAESASIASQLRLRQHEIMEKLRENDMFRYVWRFQVKVIPARYNDRAPLARAPLSNENARLLKEEAGHTKDKNLREVLEKLASHVQN